MERMTVPEWLENDLPVLMFEAMEDFDQIGLFEESSVEEIEHRSRDGFTPFTNGGYSAMVMDDIFGAIGSGRAPDDVRKTYDENWEYCFECWRDENDLPESFTYDQLYNESEGKPYDSPEYERLESFYEYESTWFSEQSEFWYVLRATFYSADNYRNDSGQDEIFFHVGVNTDYGYGRDEGLNIQASILIPVSRLTPWRLKRIINGLAARCG